MNSNHTTASPAWTAHERLSTRVAEDWAALGDRVSTLPRIYRDQLEPLVAMAIEEARFRQRVVDLACEALRQSSLERKMLEFDLEATRREREEMRSKLVQNGLWG